MEPLMNNSGSDREGTRWTVYDRYGNVVYMTKERWEHIIDPINHPEFAEYETELMETIKRGTRKQDSYNPQKYKYMKEFDNLPAGNTHVVAVVLNRFKNESGRIVPNNYIVTAYQIQTGR